MEIDTQVQVSVADLALFAQTTRNLFAVDHKLPLEQSAESLRVVLNTKYKDEYEHVNDLPPALLRAQAAARARKQTGNAPLSTEPLPTVASTSSIAPQSLLPPIAVGTSAKQIGNVRVAGHHPFPNAPGVVLSDDNAIIPDAPSDSSVQNVISKIAESQDSKREGYGVGAIIKHANIPEKYLVSNALARVQQTKPRDVPKPKWHAPWKLMRVISGHLGWVHSISVDPTNQWFATGSKDKIIKIWDLASGTLKVSLTGHIESIRAVKVAERHPYLFSCGEDKMVKCWDLEYNKVIRHYHGHLSAVYCLDLHPTLDLLVTGGRDSSARLWDMRTKQAVHILSSHTNTVADVKCQEIDPQVVTSSMDSTVRLWDIVAGKTRVTLTNHKKSVRSLVMHPTEMTFASASPDNIKQWKFPDGDFLQNLSGHRAIVNTLSINADNVLFSGADNGSMVFWDWKSGYAFQKTQTKVQSGSLDSEAGIFSSTFDRTGSRLLTGEADKSIKVWREDDEATEESHPILWEPSLMPDRY